MNNDASGESWSNQRLFTVRLGFKCPMATECSVSDGYMDQSLAGKTPHVGVVILFQDANVTFLFISSEQGKACEGGCQSATYFP